MWDVEKFYDIDNNLNIEILIDQLKFKKASFKNLNIKVKAKKDLNVNFTFNDNPTSKITFISTIKKNKNVYFKVMVKDFDIKKYNSYNYVSGFLDISLNLQRIPFRFSKDS